MTYIPEGFNRLEALSDTRKTKFDRPEQVLEQGKNYQAVVHSSKGRMVLDLYQDEAPETVNNFVFLARHQYYDGIVFHRVLEDFMAQTGDPTGTGRGGPGYQFADEVDTGLQHDGKGILSMANAGPNTNGSQFFIVFQATPWLNGKHTVFGKVIDGLDVLDSLTRIDPMRPGGVQPDKIESLYIVEK